MSFIVEYGQDLFKHTQETAKGITIEVHNTGSGIAGVYSHEIAEQLGIEATKLARANGFQLQINIEQE